MNQKTTPDNPELAKFRSQIDALDVQIINLLKDRIAIVNQVGELKRKTAPGRCPIRPGREADMLRTIMKEFEGSSFKPESAAAIWRIIIGASTAAEAPLNISVYAPERESDMYWMAREYFGPTAGFIRQPHIKRVIGDIIDGKASVGVIPMAGSSDSTYWWTNLVQGVDTPKIFARIPFVLHDTPGKKAPAAFAIARVMPEETGDDQSLLVLEADQNVSQNRLQTAFVAAKLDVNWIDVASISAGVRHHFIEIQGFATTEHDGIKALKTALGPSVMNISFLGAYAVPVLNHKSKKADYGE